MMKPLTLREFLKLAEDWKDLGWAVQKQLQAVVDGQPFEEQNEGALQLIAHFLMDANIDDENLGTYIIEYLADRDEEEEQ